MTKFSEGDDVVIDFKGVLVPGEVIRESNGWVMAVVHIDPETDWGRGRPGARPALHGVRARKACQTRRIKARITLMLFVCYICFALQVRLHPGTTTLRCRGFCIQGTP